MDLHLCTLMDTILTGKNCMWVPFQIQKSMKRNSYGLSAMRAILRIRFLQ